MTNEFIMTFIQALILSIVEGITEFLPISSTGHLVLTSEVLNIPQTDFVKSFEIFIQLGAICAVVFLYWQTFLQFGKAGKQILAAFLPTAILGLVFYQVVKHYLLGNSFITISALFIGGIILILFELIHKKNSTNRHSGKSAEGDEKCEVENIPIKTAFLIGLFQSASMIPGVSRAAATIIAGLFLGVRRKAATEFSFLLAVPTMLAATGLDLVKSRFSFTSYEYLLLATGFAGSFIVAILAIKWLLSFIQTHTFIPFGIYRIILSLIFFFIIFT